MMVSPMWFIFPYPITSFCSSPALRLWPARSCGRWLNSTMGMTWAWVMKRWRTYSYQQNQACRPGELTPDMQVCQVIWHSVLWFDAICCGCPQHDSEVWRWWRSWEAWAEPLPSPPSIGAWTLGYFDTSWGRPAFPSWFTDFHQHGIKNWMSLITCSSPRLNLYTPHVCLVSPVAGWLSQRLHSATQSYSLSPPPFPRTNFQALLTVPWPQCQREQRVWAEWFREHRGR